ncbi:DUF805 domain-containing protein [Roseobacter weihaiensis]|uniref:DUF805 domain-containing protein n=1 Tax=Roseobacter weihaiensis TaxID=2763262 RepID=UPI001D0ACA3D|nr:DUF805 domain-containing protein [Roseobacter sp. H9]
MTLTQSVKTCFQKYFTFSGRASRSEYWWFWLFCILAGFVIGAAESFIRVASGARGGTSALSAAFSLLVFSPALASGWRRLHDVNKSGWWLLAIPVSLFCLLAAGFVVNQMIMGTVSNIMMETHPPSELNGSRDGSTVIVSFVLAIILLAPLLLLLYWLTRPSQPGPNKYGPNPHEVTP